MMKKYVKTEVREVLTVTKTEEFTLSDDGMPSSRASKWLYGD